MFENNNKNKELEVNRIQESNNFKFSLEVNIELYESTTKRGIPYNLLVMNFAFNPSKLSFALL